MTQALQRPSHGQHGGSFRVPGDWRPENQQNMRTLQLTFRRSKTAQFPHEPLEVFHEVHCQPSKATCQKARPKNLRELKSK